MKKMVLLLLISGSLAHSKGRFARVHNSKPENLMLELPFQNCGVEEMIEEVAISSQDHQLQIAIDTKKFSNARKLIENGAQFDQRYAKMAFIRAMRVNDSDTFGFFLSQKPPQAILNEALALALDEKLTNFPLPLLENGAYLDANIPHEKITEYSAYLAELTANPQPYLIEQAVRMIAITSATTRNVTNAVLQQADSFMQHVRELLN